MELCPNRGEWRQPGPEERLVFLLLLPQQLMPSGRIWGHMTSKRTCLILDVCVRQITCGSTIQGNAEAVLLMLYQICWFLLCHKEAKAARLSRRGSPAVLTGWRGNRWHTVFTQLCSVISPLEPPSWTREVNIAQPWLNQALQLVWKGDGLFTMILGLPPTPLNLADNAHMKPMNGAKPTS